ncbi:hypothetical protein [Methylobacterium gregans]|uniref:Uncharacterized protein n=1 Tax=Methylobacterium gregans TaxID=374424 RepID=A0AA37HLA5_9HYPH|nr:hypothetical protein [Methylobacterium gregans]MDQ0519125.1 hypothetical protein [Methylobacterium gregans]GJD77693.1 hypothetical protein NBEOAGPD_0900 [Methylobacterium gregans]GLS53699.1 hypothetical protein GCM10007886_18820 [Methylobacterium gregans]
MSVIESSGTARAAASASATPRERRATAVAHANQLRALAWIALRDGAPHGAMRAATARTAARRILQHERRAALLNRALAQALEALVEEQADLVG